MAIAPIDLQTLFSQVDKVGRSQSAAREGQALHQSIQGVEIQRKTDEHIRQVNETQNMGEGVEKLNDSAQNHGSGENGNKGKRQHEEIENEEGRKLRVISDPSLGKKIDISL